VREYNESLELQRYVWQFLVGLMSSEEQIVEKEWHAQQHQRYGQTHIAEFLNKRHGLDASMEVQKVRRIGFDTYTKHICERLQRDKPNEFYIHRCSQCARILFTPVAQQCFWCGADWHHSGSK
jgi:hypothetical protein